MCRQSMSRAEWLQLRRSGIGGSDMPSLLGICPFGGTPYGVWQAKVYGAVDSPPTVDMQRGTFLEPIIRDLYARHTGNSVTVPELQRHRTETWAIANLDGLVTTEQEASPGVLEIKAPRTGGFYALEDGGVPANYQVQVQHYLGVTGLQWAHFCAWNADAFRLLIVRIERDDELIRMMWSVAREFWERHVLTGIPPETTAVAPRINLSPLGRKVMPISTPEWLEAAQLWREAKHILHQADAYESQCREKLVSMALQTGHARVRGGDVSVSIDKNGTPRVRDSSKREDAA